ncbi:hypothetical protein GCM10009554_72470 [Kribbella koreensis]|uniref:Peptidoglycan recognition protein family domain-containing protein n=1 Tax=Kribbella koreensis TaxID=57909 RepID=A0ABN1RKU8_9ACTN
MVDYLPRSAWGARAPKPGPGNLLAARVRGVAIHWPGTGTTTPIHSQASVASALRGWQAFHMDDRGWSDIAYQVAVDQSGRAWTLRGLREQSGANGDVAVNQQYGAILLVLVTGEQPTAAMKATTRAVVADFRRLYPRGTTIVPHSAIRPDPTDCPGPAARAAITRGDFNPDGSSEDEMTPAQMQELKNFIEARTQAYALWVQKQLSRQVEEVGKKYALDIKNFERQTDGPDAARAAAAVWATQPKPTDNPTGPTDPVDPTDPTDPVDPADPSDPSDPTDPADPNDPGGPKDPTEPEDPKDSAGLVLDPFPPLPPPTPATPTPEN